MRKKILGIFLLGSVLATSVVAGDYKKGDCDFKKDGNSKMNMEKREFPKSMHFGIIRAIHDLDLTDEQKSKIREIMKNTKPKVESYAKAFEDNKFNKDAYIDISMNKYKNMIEFKATLIEKIYTVLRDEQKTELKDLLEKSSNEPRKGKKNDKHCNGGR